MFSTILLVVFCVLMSILMMVNIGVLVVLIKIIKGFSDMSSMLGSDAELIKALDIFN